MKNHCLKKAGSVLLLGLILFFFSNETFAQISQPTNMALIFSYNAAGERVQRKLSQTQMPGSVRDSVVAMATAQSDESVKTETLAFDFSVYPNPVNSSMTITMTGEIPEAMDMYIRDMKGNVLLTQTFTSATTQVDLGDLAMGNYLIEILSGNQRRTSKIVKL